MKREGEMRESRKKMRERTGSRVKREEIRTGRGEKGSREIFFSV